MNLFGCRGFSAARFVLAGLLALALHGELAGQTATLFRPRSLLSGARAIGLGDAFVADIYNVNSMYWNPATLVYMQHASVVFNHTLDRSSNMMNENISTPLFMRKGEVVAIGVMVSHLGEVSESPLSDFKALQYGYDVAYSREILPTFCVGGAFNVRYASAESGNLWAFSSSIGVFYSPAEGIRYGAVLGGLGNGIRYTYDGVSTILSSEKLARDLQVGATMQFPSAAKRTILTLSIANEKDFSRDGLRYKGGVEYIFLRLVALRIGYIVDPDVRVPTYGVGLRAGRFQLDYGMLPSRLTDRLYQFTLGFDLWSSGESIRTDR